MPSQVLESVPGLIVAQHSGGGKADQYFLRGFSLDHGTDIGLFVDDMPVNMRTHAHGQGYADTNFLIPEIMKGLAYRKGPYSALDGDFSSVGAVYVGIVDKFDKNFGQVEVGSFGYARSVAGMSASLGTGNMLVAGEAVHLDGPWDRPDDFRKLNGVMRYSVGSGENGFSVTGMAYSGRWYSTNQVPERAVDSGLIGRFGTMDPTDGGISQRFSLSTRWSERHDDQLTRVTAYAIRSDLDLFSNFTYFLRDQVNGDQFQQGDHRNMFGGTVSRTYFGTFNGLKTETEIGVQTRYDDIRSSLAATKERVFLSTIRDDTVKEFSVGVYGQNTLRWTDWFRTVAGVRVDWFDGTVASNLVENSGHAEQALTSPKLSLIFGPWAKTEFYLSAGTGYHSNDMRGVTISVDPSDPSTKLDKAPLLVQSRGAEVGIRSEALKGFSSTLAVFILDFDSELVFSGDSGTTEASRPSRRIGGEYTLAYKIFPGLTLDFSAAYTHARFLTDDPEKPGRYIPLAVEGVVGTGLTFEDVRGGWFGALRWRYFGPRPLIEDNSLRSKPMMPLSARIGYKFDNGWIVRFDGYNILNEKAHQIDYYYASRLPGEPPDGVNDIHFHPLEPASVRLTVTKKF
jgi:outer membrane receptor protein involved in Fe transport